MAYGMETKHNLAGPQKGLSLSRAVSRKLSSCGLHDMCASAR